MNEKALREYVLTISYDEIRRAEYYFWWHLKQIFGPSYFVTGL